MFRFGSYLSRSFVMAGGAMSFMATNPIVRMDDNTPPDHFVAQPSFQATINLHKPRHSEDKAKATLDGLMIIAGTGHDALSKEVAALIGKEISDSSISRFADGEVSIRVNDSIRGKDVFIIQPCSAPVNDSIIELLLTIATVRRSGAHRVTAVIPYFGYKHHRRGMSTSTKHQSRFLSSAAMDFAKMLQEMGVDHVVAVDLQRPGQGHEACFFDNNIPLEVIVTTDYMIDYFVKHVKLENPIVVITPNAECVKKARKFQIGLRDRYQKDVKLAAFFHTETGSGPTDVEKLEFLTGKAQIAGSDVVIVDDMVDSAGTLSEIAKRLDALGAANVYVCASHGLFTQDSMKLIDNGIVKKVFVTNSLPLPINPSSKIEQISVAHLLANVILSEHFRRVAPSNWHLARISGYSCIPDKKILRFSNYLILKRSFSALEAHRKCNAMSVIVFAMDWHKTFVLSFAFGKSLVSGQGVGAVVVAAPSAVDLEKETLLEVSLYSDAGYLVFDTNFQAYEWVLTNSSAFEGFPSSIFTSGLRTRITFSTPRSPDVALVWGGRRSSVVCTICKCGFYKTQLHACQSKAKDLKREEPGSDTTVDAGGYSLKLRHDRPFFEE
eukprot:gene598-1155_t